MRVIIAAAGTGGHINPGLAIANKIKKEEPNSEIIFIGTSRGLENDLVPRAGYKLKTIEAHGLSKSISISNIKNMVKTAKGFKQAEKIIKEFKPDVVIGMGGYICGAVITAAHKLKIPTMLHESNAYPGLAIKLLSKKVDTILVGFEDAKKRLPKAKKIVVTGTPIKATSVQLTNDQKQKIKEELKFKNDLPIVLIFGGSQGAKVINRTLTDVIIHKNNKNYQIIWAAGPGQYDGIKQELEDNNIDINNIKNVRIVPYIYNMDEIMQTADLIVARSGAMTLAEIAIAGKPAIFIPLPSKSANRQEDNARVFERAGAAKVILNSDLNEEKLTSIIKDIISNKDNLIDMGNKAKKMAFYNVEDKIYDEIQNTINKYKK